MRLTRRTFLAAVGAASATTALTRNAAAAAGDPAPPPAADLRALMNRGLDAARSNGASYADVRIERLRRQSFRSRDDHLVSATDDESYGVGVRVLVDGTWGFAATHV